MKNKIWVGPLRFMWGADPEPARRRRSQVETRPGYTMDHICLPGKVHRIIIKNPHGHLVARIQMTDAEWKGFTHGT